MTDYSLFCAPGVVWKEEMVAVQPRVSLEVITFQPSGKPKNSDVLFVAGWISRIQGWRDVLLEMTRDTRVIYVETREKISARVRGGADYGVQAISSDLVAIVNLLS